MRTARRTAALLGLLAAVLLCAGCIPQGLAFRVDDRLTITSPEDRAQVALPVTIRWSVEDFEVVPPGGPVRDGAGYFAVFVDRAPMPPGKPLAWLARDDSGCRAEDGCPDTEYLASRDVYVTTETQLVLEQLTRDDEEDRRELHRATIVLLDASGTRLGESAFEISFEVDREPQP